ncbi:MAG TPA: BatA domain-containing protein [Pirellulales bacterium]|nr:BatA domain-containing protein [Pirellulales bacterium]
MLSFVNPLLLGGLALVAVPVLIHLINLVQHRRVQWAAMEFLLESMRRNSRWIRVKELLLLLLRMAAIAAVVLILARPQSSGAWGLGLGRKQIEHVVLLDDSYSMSDHWADTTAFDQGMQTILQLARQMADTGHSQTFTLFRYSRTRGASGAAAPDMLQELVTSDFASQLENRMRSWRPTDSDVGPATTLAAARNALGPPEDAQRVLYLVTDFRSKDWNEPGETATELARWNADGAQIHLIDCVDAARPNVAVTALEPQAGTRAASVSMAVDVTVQNFGHESLRDVPIEIEQDGVGYAAVRFDSIPAEHSETRTFQVLFPTAGQHVITARAPSDAVAADNTRFAVVDLPISVPVLIVDGDPTAPDARLLAAVLNPGGSVKTGIDVQIESPAFLNAKKLDHFRVIYLTGIERLDEAGVTALETFVRRGGGVAFFVGPRTSAEFFNTQLYRKGEGIFPAPLLADTQLIVDRLEKAPDLEVTDHPIFRALAGERNSFLSSVTIERFMLVPKDWRPAPESRTHVIARLRNGSPLALERNVDKGRVIAMLTTAGPAWNNWQRNPSFVVTVLQIQAWLGASSAAATSQPVGTPLQVRLDASRYQPRAEFTPPATSGLEPSTVDLTAGADGLTATINDTQFSGIYQLLTRAIDGAPEPRLFAVNVRPEEGALARLDGTQLQARLPSVHYSYQHADQLPFSSREVTRSGLGDTLLLALVALLVGEQALAYVASYHRQRAEAPAR